jgi:hypothetical protein
MFKKYSFLTIRLTITCLCLLLGGIYAQSTVEEEPGIIEGAAVYAPPGMAKTKVSPFLRTAFSGPCSFDSGWVPIDQDEDIMIEHNLGGSADDYVVYMVYRSADYGHSNSFYGGVDFGATSSGGTLNNQRHGAYWYNLTIGSISVYRRPEDTYADFVRVKIWADPSDNWDSGWVNVNAGNSSTLSHNLLGNTNDYIVYMEFKDNEVYGIHQMFYGGGDLGANAADGFNENDRIGAYWYSLDNDSITIYRRTQDVYADQIRVRIFLRPSPTYDSGWTTVNQNESKGFMHKIWISVDDYVIDLQYRHPTHKVNQIFFGGNDIGNTPPIDTIENDRVGAYWTSLNPNSITVYRRSEDIYAPEVRVRIWHNWKPYAPQYDSLWVDIAADSIIGLNHNLTAAPGSADETGLIDLQFRNVSDGINQRYYGGFDFGNKTLSGSVDNERTGAYWYNLSNTSITIKRRVEDTNAAQVRLRIWQMPKPDYNSGWVSLINDAGIQLNHYLGGDTSDYLVDLQYKSPVYGINHIFYGGGDFGNNPPSGLSEDDRMGAYWRSLTDASIYVYRRPEDLYAPDVRLRIWRICPADYARNWFLLNQDTAQALTHNLGGNAQLYLVKMEQYSAGNGINQRHYGGADFGASPPAGYAAEDRVGAYWRSLTSSSITVYRRPEDGFAEQLQVRIWRLPPYISIYDLRDYLIGKQSYGDRILIDGDVNGDSGIDIADIIYYMKIYDKSF